MSLDAPMSSHQSTLLVTLFASITPTSQFSESTRLASLDASSASASSSVPLIHLEYIVLCSMTTLSTDLTKGSLFLKRVFIVELLFAL